MGDRYERTKPHAGKEDKDRPKKKKSRRDSGEEHIATSKGSNLLSSELEELSGIYYRPRTRETRSAYEILLSFIQQAIGDQPRDILCGAADEVLATLKDEHLREREKQREISSLLGSVEDDKFALLVGLGKKITDYGAERHTTEEDEAIDESYGVAVVFHEEEEGGGGKGETTVAQDEGEEEGGDEEEGMEADYEGVLHADVGIVATTIHFCSPYIKKRPLGGFPDCWVLFDF